MRSIALTNTTRVVLVDDQDFDFVAGRKWTAQKGRQGCLYAVPTTAAGRDAMHRQIAARMGIGGSAIDHINGDGLDNRRANLRACDHAQNAWNAVRPTGSSGVPGVCKNRSGWAVRFDHRGKRIYLGTFKDLAEAAGVAMRARAELRGDYDVTKRNSA
jgi:hypothetical protein